MFDVITVGSATKDVYFRSPKFDIIRKKDLPTGLGLCLGFGFCYQSGIYMFLL